ncbi:2-dehydro-3-deoxygalactonokinase [Shewanella sp. C32]|uniref:2-dehydro-3-deoxygalactonokinase n=1 Tax=Shewanella electrica TaxID=515560 RepID=A0ABT2FTB8_9GAMM|nr:2-dehydro-3-deoxygalactonokinase [Shewanella electrica]MCH1925704.1 2-dehydro-3-deoxygalactonokinase [Shewanella electrica]MCS4558469.1 2-dehydro-3-deoxygalactonokinase [Shewanella electrica]
MAKQAVSILVDWGTTNFRAYLLDENGVCLAETSAPSGISQINGAFEATLNANIGEWLNTHDNLTVVLAGMIGSQIGWKNTPYVDCPAPISGYGQYGVQVPEFNHGNCWIIPGMKQETADGKVDVMRGEELQVIGASMLSGDTDAASYCCPGTHTKWVKVNNQQIQTITTAMTGETFSLLSKHSILAHSLDTSAPLDEAAFIKGVQYSQQPGGLLNHIFSVRTLFVTGKQATSAGAGYLSGLLIGHEIRAFMEANGAESIGTCHIIGSSSLNQLYQTAMNHFGISTTLVADKDASIAGANSLIQTLKDRLCRN